MESSSQFTLLPGGLSAVKTVGDHQSDHCIPEELKPLVARALSLPVRVGGVLQSDP